MTTISMPEFKVGDKVKCIIGNQDCRTINGVDLKKGEIYTVTALYHGTSYYFVYLDNLHGMDDHYDPIRFDLYEQYNEIDYLAITRSCI